MSMTFKTKCKWCGQRFEITGHAAFDAALVEHRKTCTEPAKPVTGYRKLIRSLRTGKADTLLLNRVRKPRNVPAK